MATKVMYGTTVTDPMIFTLYSIDPSDGTQTVIDLTGVTDIELFLRPHGTGSVVEHNLAGKLAVVSPATAGQVSFSPASGDLVLVSSGYDAYFMITDASSVRIRVPSNQDFLIEIVESFTP